MMEPDRTTTASRTAVGQRGKTESAESDIRHIDSPEEDKDETDVLEAALSQLGHFGLYQKYIVLMMCIPNLLAAMYSFNYVFVAGEVPFRCVIPECEYEDVFYNDTAVAALLPEESSCRRYEPISTQEQDTVMCNREQFHPNKTIKCQTFVYESTDTTFAEFNLACREWMRTLVGTIRNLALPIALLLTGYLSDLHGRRTAFCIFAACAGLLGIIKGFSVNYYMYVTFEFLEATLGYGFNSAGYVMIIELARPSLRVAFASATGIAYGLGGVLFAFIAWKISYWRKLLWTIHIPALLLPVYWMIIDESPRWLHSQKRNSDVAKVIRKAARWNKITLDEDLIKGLEYYEHNRGMLKGARNRNPWISLLKSKVLMGRFAACCWCWIVTSFVYYGLTINSVRLSGDEYVNFALTMTMEIVASLLIMMTLERFGRKWSLCVAFLVSGFACVLPFFISHTGTGLGMYFLGKLSITFAFNSMYVYTAELFPTSTRSSALAACSLVGRIGSITAPQTPLLSLSVQAVLYGVCSLTGALCVLLVAETRRVRLPHDVTEAENLQRDLEQLPLEIQQSSQPTIRIISADVP